MVNRDIMLREIAQRNDAEVSTAWRHPSIYDNEAQGVTWSLMMSDAAVGSAIREITDDVMDRPWCLMAGETPDTSPIGVALTADLAQVDVRTAMESALEAIWRGFACLEISWVYSLRRFHLAGLADLDAENIAFVQDERGRIVQVVNQPGGGEQLLPVEKCWLHRHRPSRVHPAGRSMLQRAYRSYLAKDQTLKRWGLSMQRFGMPFFVAQMPESSSAVQRQAVLDAFYGLRLDGVAIVPDNVAYQRHDPSYAQTVSFAEAIHYHDSQIRQAVLHQISSGSVLGAERGIGPGVTAQAGQTQHVVECVAQELADSFTRQVIEPLVVCNWGEAALLAAPTWGYPKPKPQPVPAQNANTGQGGVSSPGGQG